MEFMEPKTYELVNMATFFRDPRIGYVIGIRPRSRPPSPVVSILVRLYHIKYHAVHNLEEAEEFLRLQGISVTRGNGADKSS
jgi:hypothetical protein